MLKGKLVLIVGPMFAGKTTYLIEKANQLKNKKILIVKPKLDNRYNKQAIVTHNHKKFPAQIIDENDPRSLINLYQKNYSYLFIDELNFFSFNTIWPQFELLLKQGVIIYAAGLEYDYQQKIFGPIHRLRKYATKVIQLYAVCDGCGGKATLSYRKKVRHGQIVVGGAELYGACCAKCYPKLNH